MAKLKVCRGTNVMSSWEPREWVDQGMAMAPVARPKMTVAENFMMVKVGGASDLRDEMMEL